MGRTYFENKKKLKAYLVQDTQSGAKKIYRMYHGNERIYPNAGMVTYHVDTNVTYTEEVDIDESILNPSTFTPSKSGWTFVGWRKDTTASGSVISDEVMTGDDVTLYAVFKQTITLSYNGNGATGGSTSEQTGIRYYNNGNTSNPSFILKSNGFSRTYYNFVNWRMGSVSGTPYNPGSSVILNQNTVFYAEWLWDGVMYSVSRGYHPALGGITGGYFANSPSDYIGEYKGDVTHTGFSANLVDFTKYKTMSVTFSGNDAPGETGRGRVGYQTSAGEIKYVSPNIPNGVSHTRTLDISSVNGMCYLYLYNATVSGERFSTLNTTSIVLS